MLPKYKLIKIEIENKQQEIKDLTTQMQKLCPHKNIKYESYCNDSWAQNPTYTAAYKCLDCGLYASFDPDLKEEKSDKFKKLEKLYDKEKFVDIYLKKVKK